MLKHTHFFVNTNIHGYHRKEVMIVMFRHSQSYRDVYSPGLLEAERALSESSCQQTTKKMGGLSNKFIPLQQGGW